MKVGFLYIAATFGNMKKLNEIRQGFAARSLNSKVVVETYISVDAIVFRKLGTCNKLGHNKVFKFERQCPPLWTLVDTHGHI